MDEIKVPDTEAAVALGGVLERWKAGIDAHQPDRVSAVFTEDAIFQGLRPYSVGRQGVIDYYADRPSGMTVEYQILQTRRLAADHMLGYVNADFTFPAGNLVSVFLGVLIELTEDGWSIAYYQASHLE